MPWWAWVTAAASGGIVLATGVPALLGFFRLLRRAGAFADALETRIPRLEALGDELARRGEDAAATGKRLEQSLAALEASGERLRVLGWALEDVRTLLGIVRAAVPTK